MKFRTALNEEKGRRRCRVGVYGLVPVFTLDGSLGGVGVLIHAEEANICKVLN